jgi:hypothetical protein
MFIIHCSDQLFIEIYLSKHIFAYVWILLHCIPLRCVGILCNM